MTESLNNVAVKPDSTKAIVVSFETEDHVRKQLEETQVAVSFDKDLNLTPDQEFVNKVSYWEQTYITWYRCTKSPRMS